MSIEQYVLEYNHNYCLNLDGVRNMRHYERLRNLREDKDLTQAEMGKLLNISQRAYAHYEAGTRNIPIDVLIDIADIFNVSLDYITERTDTK